MTLPDWVGQRLLEMAPKRVTVVEPKAFQPGMWCEWWSPLFGHCTGQIKQVIIDGCIITDHSVLKGEEEPVTIPASWICGIYMEEQAS